MFRERFGQRLKAARTGATMTQQQVCDALRDMGVKATVGQISKYEKGGDIPQHEKVFQLALVLSIDPDELDELWRQAADEVIGAEAAAKKALREMTADRDYVIHTTKQFLTQYEDLGHTYRRLDEESRANTARLERLERDAGANKKRLEGLIADVQAVNVLQEEMQVLLLTQMRWIERLTNLLEEPGDARRLPADGALPEG